MNCNVAAGVLKYVCPALATVDFFRRSQTVPCFFFSSVVAASQAGVLIYMLRISFYRVGAFVMGIQIGQFVAYILYVLSIGIGIGCKLNRLVENQNEP